MEGPTHSVEFVVGQGGSTDDNEPTNDDRRDTCDEEDAPKGPKNCKTIKKLHEWKISAVVYKKIICVYKNTNQ